MNEKEPKYERWDKVRDRFNKETVTMPEERVKLLTILCCMRNIKLSEKIDEDNLIDSVRIFAEKMVMS
jgi:hypothetical protein